ncbi:hypothetical protein H6788_00975 [Candidatus Nomurabacteria bacterium]|nr:hypothetical protein [Candidatus Nomurabacteria bacterium]
MPKKVIAVDFDDVVMHFNAGFLDFHNRLFGTSLVYENLTRYDDWEVVYGCDKDTMAERAHSFYHSPEHMLASPVSGAVEAIRLLSETYSLQIVTSRPDSTRPPTLKWLDNHFPRLFHNFHFTNIYAGTLDTKPKAKSEVCREIGAIVLIDDAMKHARDVADSGVPVLLPDRPWNQGPDHKGVHRVHSWEETVNWIRDNT